MKISKIISFTISTTLIVSSLCNVCAKADSPVSVELDGNLLSFDVKPQIVNGRTLVPLRKTFEELGAFVKWNGETKTVSARRNSKTVTLTIDSADMQIDKGDTDEDGNAIIQTVTLDVPAQIVSNRTLIPMRAVSEAFGYDVAWDEQKKLVSISSGNDEDDTWKNNEGKIGLSDMTFDGEGIEVSGNTILITKGGDYSVSGILEDGNIAVRTDKKVKLRLDGVSMTSKDEPCIYFEEADKAYITISEGTENTLTSECEKGVIYSKEDLEIKGGGTLNINAKTDHGIKASDNLTIENGIINITAEGDGIHVNDTFKMSGAELNIDSVGDGIDSESIVAITGGSINIKTNGKPIETANAVNTGTEATNSFMGGHGRMAEVPDVEFESSSKGIKAEWMLCISGVDIVIESADHAIHCADEIEISGGKFSISSEYGKGISGHGNVLLDGADTEIDIAKSTEGLESKNILTVNNGIINITSSDDGINATGGESGEMMGPPPNRNMDEMPPIPPEWEEFENMPMPHMSEREANLMPIENMNIGSKPDKGQETKKNRENIRQETEPFSFAGNRQENKKNCLIINGGEITVKANDDCIDSNGSILINGGSIKAVKSNGTLTGNNSIFDAEGQVNINSGVTIVAAGDGGTLNLPQNCITVYGDSYYQSGDKIVLCNANGNVLTEYTPSDSFSAVFISYPEMILGEKYTVKIGNSSYDVILSEQNTVIGTPVKRGRAW